MRVVSKAMIGESMHSRCNQNATISLREPPKMRENERTERGLRTDRGYRYCVEVASGTRYCGVTNSYKIYCPTLSETLSESKTYLFLHIFIYFIYILYINSYNK